MFKTSVVEGGEERYVRTGPEGRNCKGGRCSEREVKVNQQKVVNVHQLRGTKGTALGSSGRRVPLHKLHGAPSLSRHQGGGNDGNAEKS